MLLSRDVFSPVREVASRLTALGDNLRNSPMLMAVTARSPCLRRWDVIPDMLSLLVQASQRLCAALARPESRPAAAEVAR
jgi:hypothetical protein